MLYNTYKQFLFPLFQLMMYSIRLNSGWVVRMHHYIMLLLFIVDGGGGGTAISIILLSSSSFR